MATIETPPRTIALVYNSALPNPLGTLSIHISSHAIITYIQPHIPQNYLISTIDIATYDFPNANSTEPPAQSSFAKGPDPMAQSPTKTVEEWEQEMEKHSGYIFLFPFHIWSYSNPLKSALDLLPSYTLSHKPALLLSFGKEEPNCPHDYGRMWKRRAGGMMREFLEGKAMSVMSGDGYGNAEREGRGAEFVVYEDYWAGWEKGEAGGQAWIGGQQAELWENYTRRRCVEGIRVMVGEIEEKRVGKGDWIGK